MEGWKEINLGKLGDTFTGLSGKTKDDFGFGSKYIQYVNIFNNTKIDVENLELVNVKSNEKQSKVRFGDIFFTTSSETIEEVGMSSVLLDEVNEDIYLNSFCFGFRLFDFDSLLPEFAQHLLRAAHMRHSISMFGKGSTRYNLSKTLLLKDLVLVFPSSHTEQHKIATILNTLDQSIAQTKSLISKYKNIKQGLMHDLLNYGIDENGTIRNPQTHTFVEKKGLMVPEEWEVEELSKHILLLNGGTPSTTNPNFWNGNIPWLSVDDFNTGKRFVYDANKKITEDGLKYSSTRLLFVDDIIISARGTVGVIAQLRKEMAFNQSCYGIRNNSVKIYANDFIYFYLKFYFQSKGVIKTGSTFDTITKNTFDEIFISLPSKTEQQKIISIIEQQDKLIESEQTNLTKLQRLKQGLMADLLTGKVRVKI